MTEYQDLIAEHETIQKQLGDQPDVIDIEQVERFIIQIRDAGRHIENPQQRDQLRSILKYWGAFVHEKKGEYPPTQLTPYEGPDQDDANDENVWEWIWNRRTRIIVGVVGLIVLVLCIAATRYGIQAVQDWWSNRAETHTPTPTGTSTPFRPTLAPTHTLTNTPTHTSTPTDVPTPSTPTDSPTYTPTPTDTPTPTRAPADPPEDVVYYNLADMSQVIENPPGIIDIRSASVTADMKVNLQPAAEDIPPELAGCAVAEGEALLWIELYESITSTTQGKFSWLYVLDLDGDVSTGRPSGTVASNPDLGYETAVYVEYSNGEFSSYFLVWDTQNAGFAPSISEGMRHCLDESGTLIGMVPSLNVLSQKVKEFAQVTPDLGAVKGRAAAETDIEGGQRVIDFYPNPPGQFE